MSTNPFLLANVAKHVDANPSVVDVANNANGAGAANVQMRDTTTAFDVSSSAQSQANANENSGPAVSKLPVSAAP